MRKKERDKITTRTMGPEQRRILRRRTRTVAAVMIVTFLFLLLYNLGSYLFLKQMGDELERALDQRLMATARLTTELIERTAANFDDRTESSLMRLSLNRIRLENDLEAAYLIYPQGRVFLDARQDLETSIERRYLREDSTAIATALREGVAVSRLHTVADDHFKSVYAPVTDLYGSTLVLVMEANADFLRVMENYYHGLYLGVVISLLLLGVLVTFLVYATIQFVRTESRLLQAQRLAYLGQMSATVAHEIRNPLAIIKSTADVLREKYLPAGTKDEFFDYIDDEIRRLNRLVNDFLSFSRGQELRLAEHDLVPLVSALIRTFPAADTRIEWACELESLVVRCDSDKIQQVLLNLLMNARQAVEGREGVVRIGLVRERSKGRERVCLTVRDNGPGLLGKGGEVFEPFFTTKTSGTGLGLAVSRQIIESHGGTITATEPPQGGTVMTIYLPI